MVVLKSCRLIMMAISEVRSVKEDVDLAFPSLIVPAVSVDVKPTTFPKRVFDKTALTKTKKNGPYREGQELCERGRPGFLSLLTSKDRMATRSLLTVPTVSVDLKHR